MFTVQPWDFTQLVVSTHPIWGIVLGLASQTELAHIWGSTEKTCKITGVVVWYCVWVPFQPFGYVGDVSLSHLTLKIPGLPGHFPLKTTKLAWKSSNQMTICSTRRLRPSYVPSKSHDFIASILKNPSFSSILDTSSTRWFPGGLPPNHPLKKLGFSIINI